MESKRWGKPVSKWIAAGIGAAAASYSAYALFAWRRYGRQKGTSKDRDALLDRFIPEYDVVEHHRIAVEAPADITLAVATEIDLLQSPIVKAIFKARQILMRGTMRENQGPKTLLEQVRGVGWGILAEIPGREIVFGAVTQPWVADVVFRAFPPEEFTNFCEPGFVKIVWTLRADPVDANNCVFHSETRVATTDLSARVRFRKYWSLFSAGIVLIRLLLLRTVRAQACQLRAAGSNRAVAAKR
jgi:hypothetical protein